MSETTFLLDPATGRLLAGMDVEAAATLTAGLLPPPVAVTCADPGTAVTAVPLPLHPRMALDDGVSLAAEPGHTPGEGPGLRVAAIAHGSLIHGPGRRSILAVQGCSLRCPGCATPWTHDPAGGVAMTVAQAVTALLDPAGTPRDGVSIYGGEPMDQPAALAALLGALRARHIPTLVYTGYTLEALARRPDPAIRRALALTDVLLDGPYIAGLAAGAGPWRGSRNQRLIERPLEWLARHAAGADLAIDAGAARWRS